MTTKPFVYLSLFLFLTTSIYSQEYSVKELTNDIIELKEWRLLGPFKHGKSSNIFFNELKQFHANEDNITYTEFVSLNTDSLNNVYNVTVENPRHVIDFTELLNLQENEQNYSNIYAGCVIKSDPGKKIMLNFSANDCSKIWLNNEVIHQANVIHNDIRYYNNYLKLDLKKGDNFLLVKVYNHDRDWGMFACLEKWSKEGEKRHQIDFPLRFDKKYLDRSIIDNDSIHMIWSFPGNIRGKISVIGNEIDTTFHVEEGQKLISNVSKLPDGLYKTNFSCEFNTLSQFFYKGDIHKDIKQKLLVLQDWQCDKTIKNNINAYAFRYYHLMKPEHLPDRHYKEAKWQRRIIFVYEGINKLYKYYSNVHSSCFTNINTYVSDIDSGIQYYQIFLPENYDKQNEIPLMIEFPVPIKRFSHPLESWQFADIELSELFSRLANKYNIAILDYGGRTVDLMNGNNIDEADLWENLKAVKEMINIDTTRIFLRGACQAAFNALKIGTKYPDKWAAISIMSPRFLTEMNDIQWNKQNDPLKLLGNLWDTPLLNYHSPLDPHTNIAVSEYFNDLTKREKLQRYKFINLDLEFKEFYSSEYLHQTIEFFLKHSTREKDNDRIQFSTYSLKNNTCNWFSILSMKTHGQKAKAEGVINNDTLHITTENIKSFRIEIEKIPFNNKEKLIIKHNNNIVFNSFPSESYIVINQSNNKISEKKSTIEGPFAHIFSGPFIVVKGTSGTKEENDANQKMTKYIEEQWKSLYFHNCRVKTDKKITREDVKNYHLLLIGNENSNTLIKKYRKILPLKNSINSVSINNKEITGSDLSYYLIFPNPDKSQHYIGLLGYNNPKTFNLSFESGVYQHNNISFLGWYDYRVWKSNLEEIEKGYFDKHWK
jgi:hypothetical protein